LPEPTPVAAVVAVVAAAAVVVVVVRSPHTPEMPPVGA